MIDYNDLSLGLSIAALLLCVSDLIFTITDKRTAKPQNKVFMLTVALLIINAACGIISSVAEQYKMTSDTAYFVLRTSRLVYFVTHSLLAPAFFFYISYVVGRSVNRDLVWFRKPTLHNFIVDLAPKAAILVTEVLVLLNPLLHWIWYFDENRDFNRGWGEFVFVYTTGLLFIVASFLLLMRSWKVLSPNRRNAAVFCYFLAVAGVAVQLIFSHLRIEVMMQAIGFTGVLLFIENEDDQKDVLLDVYNPSVFALDVSAAFRNKTPLKIILVRDIRIDRDAATGVSASLDVAAVEKAVADYLATKIKRYFIYSVGHGSFALLIYNGTEESVGKTAEEISERFAQPWDIGGTSTGLTSAVMIIDLPERAKSFSDVIYIAECPIPAGAGHGVMKGSDLDWIVRYSAVENAVARGLSQGSFEVYYQPTYHIDKKIYGAEALIRMHDKELGTIYPDEFIPVAEKLGLIDDIDHFVLEEVCAFLATGEPQKYGVGHINVNLSVIECMKKGFADQIIRTVKASGVEFHCISFEITESAAATDYNYLAQVVEQLKNAGFTFYIDDFGTGYSNISALFSIGSDIIKIDKSLLWGAEKSDLGMVLLRGTIKLVKEMHKRTLTEGVESENQLEILRELGCDYLQGYYFSKPIPKDEFLALLRKQAGAV